LSSLSSPILNRTKTNKKFKFCYSFGSWFFINLIEIFLSPFPWIPMLTWGSSTKLACLWGLLHWLLLDMVLHYPFLQVSAGISAKPTNHRNEVLYCNTYYIWAWSALFKDFHREYRRFPSRLAWTTLDHA